MCLAKQIFSILCEKLSIVEIQTDSNVAAPVFIGHPSVLQTHKETFTRDTVLPVIKLKRLPDV
jgi:hypothetical protein